MRDVPMPAADPDLRMEDLPEGLRALAGVIGLAALAALARYAGGTSVYIPKYDSLLREARNRRIRAAFNGCNHRPLALQYHLSETQIREILSERPGRAEFRQTHLFE